MPPPTSDWTHVDEIVLEADSAGRVSWANMHARVVLPSNLERRPLAELFTGSSADEISGWLAHAAEQPEASAGLDAEIETRAGVARVHLQPVPGAPAGQVRLRMIFAEGHGQPINAGLLAALQELRYALDQASIVAVTDPRGVIIHVNDRFCEISGYAREELLGQTHRIICSGHHDRAFFKDLWATIGRGGVWRGEICNRTKAGSLYWVDTTIVPLLDDQGRPQRYLAIRSDITEAKAAEAALRAAVVDLEALNARIAEERARQVRAEKLSSVGQLAAGVAHEINNPLAGALACVRSLRDGTVSEARRDLYFETVLDSLERIRSTVRALLDYARPMPPSNAAVSLAEIVEANVTLLRSICQKKGVQIRVAPAPEAKARGDRGQLAQATMNVLMNACYAAPARSTVLVEFAATDAEVAIHVTDAGPGIPEALRHRIFDPFYSTKPEGEGTGLGLSVTLGLVQSHGGRIDVDCPETGGTRFSIWLPRFDHS